MKKLLNQIITIVLTLIFSATLFKVVVFIGDGTLIFFNIFILGMCVWWFCLLNNGAYDREVERNKKVQDNIEKYKGCSSWDDMKKVGFPNNTIKGITESTWENFCEVAKSRKMSIYNTQWTHYWYFYSKGNIN